MLYLQMNINHFGWKPANGAANDSKKCFKKQQCKTSDLESKLTIFQTVGRDFFYMKIMVLK